MSILDRWHLAELRDDCALRAAIRPKAGNPISPWSVRYYLTELANATSIWTQPCVTLTEIAQLFPHPALRDIRRYLRTHAARIPDYAARRAAAADDLAADNCERVHLAVNLRLKGQRGAL